MNRYKKLLQNILIFMFGNAFIKIILFFTIMLYTRHFSVEEFGKYEMVLQTINLLLPVFMFGTSEAVLRYSLDFKIKDDILLSNIFIINCVGIILLVVISPLMLFLGTWLKYTVVGMLVIFSQMWFTCGQQYAKGSGYNTVFIVAGITEALLQLSLVFLSLVFFNDKILTCLYAIFVSYFIAGIYMFIKMNLINKIQIKLYDLTFIKEVLKYSLPLMPNSICWWIMTTMNRYFLGYYLGLYSVGLFAIATKIPALISVASNVIFQAWQISAVEEYDAADKNIFFSNIMNICVSVISCMVAIVIVFVKPIMMVISTEDYFLAWIYIPPLLIATIFSALQSFVGTNYMAAKATNGALYTTVLGAVLSVILNFLLVPFYGIYGAIIATTFSYIVVLGTRLLGTRKYVKIIFNRAIIIFNTFGLGVLLIILYRGESTVEKVNILILVVMLVKNYKMVLLLREKNKGFTS